MDLAPKIQYFTLDVISDIAFGKPFGNLEADQDVSSYIQAVQEAVPLAIFLATFPGLCRVFFSSMLKRFWPKTTDKVGLGKLMGCAGFLHIQQACLMGLLASLKRWSQNALAQTNRPGATCWAHSSAMVSPSGKLNLKPFSKCTCLFLFLPSPSTDASTVLQAPKHPLYQSAPLFCKSPQIPRSTRAFCTNFALPRSQTPSPTRKHEN